MESFNRVDIGKLAAIIEGLPTPVGVYTGSEMQIEMANEAMLQIWGLDGAVTGKSFYDVINRLYDRPLGRFLDKVYTRGVTHEATEERIDRMVDGRLQTFYYQFTYKPLKEASGEVWGILHTATNITERVLTGQVLTGQVLSEKKADQVEAWTQLALDTAGIGIWNADTAYHRVWWDKRCRGLVGHPGDEVVPYEEVLQYIHPLDVPKVKEAGRRALDPQSDGSFNIRFRVGGTKGREWRWIHSLGKACFDHEGNVYCFSGTVRDISSEIEAAEEKDAAEQLAQLALEGAGAGTFFIDLETDHITYSPTLAKNLTGRETIGLTRMELIKHVHPEDREKRNRAYQKALKTGKLHYEIRFVWEDSSIHWIRTVGTYAFDAAGKPVSFIGISRDITSEVKFRGEQQKLLSLIENSADYMGIADRDGKMIYLNKAGRKLVGLEADVDIIRLETKHFYTPENYARVQQDLLPVLYREGKWSGRIDLSHFKTKEVIPCHADCIVITDPVTGERVARGVTLHDLRPQMASRQALLDSEQRFRSIVLEAPVAKSLYVGPELKIELANEAMLKLWGRDGHVIGMRLKDAIPELEGQPFLALLEKVYKTGEPYHADQQKADLVVDGKLQSFWFNFTYKPLRDPGGKVYAILNVAVDVSAQVQLQKQKDEFLGIASHELKTPVTSIKAYAQVLESMLRKSGDDQKADMVRRMDAQINRLTNLIGDLLDVTKINSGKIQFNTTLFDFNAAVSEVVEEIQRTTEKHTIIKTLNPVGQVYGDKERIEQVIINLLTNAIKYSPGADKVVVYTKLKGSKVQLCVEDFGIGISRKKQARVFEQFYRVGGEKQQHTFPGLGLGLYIASEIITREGGRMWVTSTEGKGSRFCFSIPVRQ